MVLSEPYCYGMRLTVFDFELELEHGQWKVTSTKSKTLNSNTVPEDPQITKLLKADHDLVVKYVNTAVGTCTADLSAAEACWKDVPVMDFIHQVQMAAGASRPGRHGGRRPPADLRRRALQPQRGHSRRAMSPSVTSPGSTSTTTPCTARS